MLAEEALHHALEKFEKTFQAAPIWVVLSSLEDGRYMEVNEIFLKTIGYKREEVIGKTSLELNTWVDPRDRERIVAQVKEMGGVAHDFNNMLGVIQGRAELMFMGINPGDPHYEDLQEIYRATRRSVDLTRQLLAFARKQTITPKVLDLNDTVLRIHKRGYP